MTFEASAIRAASMRGSNASSSTFASPKRRASVVEPPTFGSCRSTDRRDPTSCSQSPSGTALTRVPPAAARSAGVLVMHHYLGYAPSEIAETLGIPAGTARSTAPSRTSRHAGRPRGGRSDHGHGRSIGMTHQRDIERLLDQWFTDGPGQAPDRVVDIVSDRIERQPQRPAWRLDWRPFPVNADIKIATPRGHPDRRRRRLQPATRHVDGVGGPAAREPVHDADCHAFAHARADGNPGGGRDATPFRPTRPCGRAPTSLAPGLRRITAGPDVHGACGLAWVRRPDHLPGRADGTALQFIGVTALNSDLCQWADPKGEVNVGTTVDDLVAALVAQTKYEVSDPVDVSNGGYSGKRVDVVYPAKLFKEKGSGEAPGCDEGITHLFGDGGIYGQTPDERWQTNILDVDGRGSYHPPGRPRPRPRRTARGRAAIVDSMVIEP